MSRRKEFHEILVELLGSTNVYFQPPSTVKMRYPCIIYGRNDTNTLYADNLLYKNYQAYLVTIVDSNPDSLIPEKISKLPLCRFDRYYTANNLNHDSYVIYY